MSIISSIVVLNNTSNFSSTGKYYVIDALTGETQFVINGAGTQELVAIGDVDVDGEVDVDADADVDVDDDVDVEVNGDDGVDVVDVDDDVDVESNDRQANLKDIDDKATFVDEGNVVLID